MHFNQDSATKYIVGILLVILIVVVIIPLAEGQSDLIVQIHKKVSKLKLTDSDDDGVPDIKDKCSGYDDKDDSDKDRISDGCDDSDREGLTDDDDKEEDEEEEVSPAEEQTESCAPAPTSPLIVNVKAKGAKGDGVTDDSAAIQAAIDEVAGTGGTVFVPPGVYMIKVVHPFRAIPSIHLKSNMTFRMTKRTILKAIPTHLDTYSILYLGGVEDNGVSSLLGGVTNVNVIGGTLLGDRDEHEGTSGEWGTGIWLQNATNVVIEGVTTRNMWGDGFMVKGTGLMIMGAGTDPSKNVTFCSVVADRNRRQGMSITYADGVIVKDSIFMNTEGTPPQAGIDIEPDQDETVNNVLIQRSQFTNNRGVWGAILVTVPAANSAVTNVTIDGNNITGNGGPGIGVYNTISYTITNNLIRNNGGKSTVPGSLYYGWYDGIYLVNGATNNIVIGNTVTENKGHGINDAIGGNKICGNMVFNNTLDNGDSTDMSSSYNNACEEETVTEEE